MATIRRAYRLRDRAMRLRAAGLVNLEEVAATFGVNPWVIKSRRLKGQLPLRSFRLDDQGQYMYERPAPGTSRGAECVTDQRQKVVQSAALALEAGEALTQDTAREELAELVLHEAASSSRLGTSPCNSPKATAENYLTGSLFRQILRRTERLAWHRTWSRAPRTEGHDQ